MPDAVPKSENEFLNTLRKENKRVAIFLVNGVKLIGNIQSFDSYTVYLNGATGSQVIYKHSISTVSEDRGRPQHSERRERPEPRPRPGRWVS
ncbi:RNA chaperone Hfq [Caballeronia grimmiae]|uniref:RNA chaperone Hfq n=1 Tax=Caballeronia grimmiae TaxID=1071679 RepID=UPI0038BD4DFB